MALGGSGSVLGGLNGYEWAGIDLGESMKDYINVSVLVFAGTSLLCVCLGLSVWVKCFGNPLE